MAQTPLDLEVILHLHLNVACIELLNLDSRTHRLFSIHDRRDPGLLLLDLGTLGLLLGAILLDVPLLVVLARLGSVCKGIPDAIIAKTRGILSNAEGVSHSLVVRLQGILLVGADSPLISKGLTALLGLFFSSAWRRIQRKVMASVLLLERSATVTLDRVLFLFGVPLVGATMPLRQVGCGTVEDLRWLRIVVK